MAREMVKSVTAMERDLLFNLAKALMFPSYQYNKFLEKERASDKIRLPFAPNWNTIEKAKSSGKRIGQLLADNGRRYVYNGPYGKSSRSSSGRMFLR